MDYFVPHNDVALYSLLLSLDITYRGINLIIQCLLYLLFWLFNDITNIYLIYHIIR